MLVAVIRPSRLLPALLAVLFAPTLTAITFVVPADRFEIERSSAIVVGRVLRSHVEQVPQSGLETNEADLLACSFSTAVARTLAVGMGQMMAENDKEMMLP